MTDTTSMQKMAFADDAVDPRDLRVLTLLGRGTFAHQVALARDTRTQRVVVIKSLEKKHLIRRKQVAHTMNEKRILDTLRHQNPFIVQLHTVFQTETDVHFVLEYCQGGELYYHLQQQEDQRFDEDAVRFYAAEVLSAMHELHGRGIVYRDLKPENVLLDAAGHVKLADFGFAKGDMLKGRRTYSFCGSPEYLSPEMVRRDGHGLETDLWAFGCFCYELLTGAPPFQCSDLPRLFALIQDGRVWYPPFLSASAISLLKALLCVNPSARLTTAQVQQHAFFATIDWDQLNARQLEPPIVPECQDGVCTCNFDDGFTTEPVQNLRLDSLLDPVDRKCQPQNEREPCDVFADF